MRARTPAQNVRIPCRQIANRKCMSALGRWSETPGGSDADSGHRGVPGGRLQNHRRLQNPPQLTRAKPSAAADAAMRQIVLDYNEAWYDRNSPAIVPTAHPGWIAVNANTTRTCQMQQVNALAYLTAAIRCHRRRHAVASLLPKRP